MTLIIATLIVYQQLHYMQDKKLGYDKDQVLFLPDARLLGGNQNAFEEQLLRDSRVVSATISRSVPGGEIMDGTEIYPRNENSNGTEIHANIYHVDYDYLKTLGIHVVQGRNFSKDNPGDTINAILVNESMVSRMGWKDPLGRKFLSGGGPNGPQERKVVGVIRDYNQNSLYDAIEPLIILLSNDHNYVFVRLAPGDTKVRLKAVQKTWKEIFADQPMEFTFLDMDLDSQYKADQKRSQLFTAFSCLTVFIACLGLLGLAAFTTEQRTKEIGVRKVVGASVRSLVMLVSGEFFILVAAGMMIAFPAAWYFTNNWLQNFSYRIEMTNEWSTFLVAALIAFAITLITVGFHVIRVAVLNPVRSLRDD